MKAVLATSVALAGLAAAASYPGMPACSHECLAAAVTRVPECKGYDDDCCICQDDIIAKLMESTAACVTSACSATDLLALWNGFEAKCAKKDECPKEEPKETPKETPKEEPKQTASEEIPAETTAAPATTTRAGNGTWSNSTATTTVICEETVCSTIVVDCGAPECKTATEVNPCTTGVPTGEAPAPTGPSHPIVTAGASSVAAGALAAMFAAVMAL